MRYLTILLVLLVAACSNPDSETAQSLQQSEFDEAYEAELESAGFVALEPNEASPDEKLNEALLSRDDETIANLFGDYALDQWPPKIKNFRRKEITTGTVRAWHYKERRRGGDEFIYSDYFTVDGGPTCPESPIGITIPTAWEYRFEYPGKVNSGKGWWHGADLQSGYGPEGWSGPVDGMGLRDMRWPAGRLLYDFQSAQSSWYTYGTTFAMQEGARSTIRAAVFNEYGPHCGDNRLQDNWLRLFISARPQSNS